jgi:hypothetical protein
MEIKIDKPTKYADSLLFEEESGFNYFSLNEEYFISGDATEKQLLDAFAAHNPIAPESLSPKDALLAKLGITESEAALLLG